MSHPAGLESSEERSAARVLSAHASGAERRAGRQWGSGSLAATLVVLAFGASGATAQAPEPDPIDQLVAGPESDELHALRLMELELFGAQPLAEAPDPAGRVRISAGPLSSDAPDASAADDAPISPDLDWMRGLTLPDIPVRWDDRVIRYLEFFRNDPRGNRFIRGWLRRVNRYGPTIRRTLEAQGLPRDLIFVAMVESGFDPSARSQAGAVGMWQFMEGTGESFDLQVDHWIDLRLDPERSTQAAGRYLAQLRARFGTWELAFAAYNMGYGALLRSIRKYNTNDYWTLAHLESGLPYETNLYVAKILACAIVAHNPERFGLADLESEAPIAWETVTVPGGTSLAVIARAAGSTVEALRSLNPALRRGRTPPGRESWAVRIPPANAAQFAERWARGRSTQPALRTHVLRFGETLGDLARSLGRSENELRELNGASADERIGAGTTLLVPAAARARAEATVPPLVAVPEGPREVEGRRRVFYRVVRGDRVSEIARFFRVRDDELRRWNRVDPDAALQTGMFLQLFVRPDMDLTQALVLTPEECRVLVVGSEEFFAVHEAQNGRVRFRYRVRTGDTLTHIAQRFGLPVSSLARINQIGRDALLRVGDELVVYADRSRVPAELLPDAVAGDALAPGGEATVERTGPDLGTPSPAQSSDASAPIRPPTDEPADQEPDAGAEVPTP